MLNDNSSSAACEHAFSNPYLSENTLKIGLDAGCCALSRLANLMAKLDVEPEWMSAEKRNSGGVLEVFIGFGDDTHSIERLVLRLSGMVALRYLERGADPAVGCCLQAAENAGAA